MGLLFSSLPAPEHTDMARRPCCRRSAGRAQASVSPRLARLAVDFLGNMGMVPPMDRSLELPTKKHIGSNAIYSSDPFRSNSLQFMAPSQVVHVLGHPVRGAPCCPSGWGPAAGCSTEGGDGWGPLGLLQLRALVLGKVWRNAGGFKGLSHADVQSQREKKEVS